MLHEKSGDAPADPSRRRLLLIVIAAVVGILLLLFGGGSLLGEDREQAEELPLPSPGAELAEYRTETEERIRVLCESVEGVSGVQVAVTLEGGFEEVYATEQKDGGEKYVIIGSGSNASALLLEKCAPQITGIGVVCHGGGNADTRRELTSLISAAFSVPSNRIYIAEAKG